MKLFRMFMYRLGWVRRSTYEEVFSYWQRSVTGADRQQDQRQRPADCRHPNGYADPNFDPRYRQPPGH